MNDDMHSHKSLRKRFLSCTWMGSWGWAFVSLSSASGLAQHPVGEWTSHVPYDRVREVMLAGDNVVARTDFALFTVDTSTYEVVRYTKGSGLSEVNPTALAYDELRQQWIVGYANGSVDFRDSWGTTNVPDFRISQVTGDKRINAITVEGDQAYLSTNLGVVVVDLTRREIADTWPLSSSAESTEAQFVLSRDGKWLVGTNTGILTASREDPFLSNADSWIPWEAYPDLGPALEMTRHAGQWWLATGTRGASNVVIWRGDDNGLWELMPGWNPDGQSYGGMDIGKWILADDGTRSEGLLVASCCQLWGWDAQGMPAAIELANPDFAQITDLVIDRSDQSGRVWLGSRVGGVITWVAQPGAESIGVRSDHPVGPPSNAVRRVDCWNDNLWLATGGVDLAWTPEYRTDGVFQFQNGAWFKPELPESVNDISEVRDIMDVSIDPTDPSHVVFSSYEEGLIEVRNREVVRVLNASNSSIQESLVGGSQRSAVSGLDFDGDGNLWFTTPTTNKCLHVMLPDGSTIGMDVGEYGLTLLFGDVEVTRDGHVWVVLARGKGLLVYNPNGTPENPTDDNWVILNANEGEGGLPSNDVFCVEEDLDGEIWVGTASGPCVFYQSESVFDGDVTSSQILISQDGNLQYLLETDLVQSIIIDGGNRKWIGTRNAGLYVISADGLSTVHHFTTENSPLPSNNVLNVAMDYASGEAYIATDQGLMSYTSGSSNWDPEMADVRVRPNPIRSDHEGPIVIDGLANESSVHITNAAGNRLALLQSEGGRATWDGKLEDGKPAPFGIYLAFATDRNGKKGAVVKFAILR
ncbi:MAG: hypothetical protein VYA72_04320 [Bacteroidota bacterium]|nr:hypothetical protein [Bacteroidota bacterium]